ncbi:DUF3383 family protein [Brevibacillus laterosporus]|uniref:DUF3383 family protein n=1 Tax=Brevibacillus laterosporus TaxID=1465 RepID=A0AAP3DET3_BRELA|nr:DUF3383 family protein [Brevibacillus laterosporus]AYB36805.1 DUF3383 family protein [Brevibacillus laterosporus]AYB41052.1 DUF3383 family protein [Brevibacillus laterosporus]MCR8978684.1 DUF3383 domain-containing protein [Brevibacillus laterosporus]MCZ0805840.1 DUF3383 family protein [Brevibacillus laterosporus]
MAVKSDVTVTIDIQRPTPKLGFGKPLIIGTSAAGMAYKTYYDLDAVREDFAPSTEVYKAAFALLNQGDKSPSELAVMLHKTEGETLADFLPKIFEKDWYFLVSTSSQKASILTIADAIEQNDSRQFFASSSNLEDLAAIKAKKYTRTTMFYHTTTDNYPEAAWLGACASADVGSITWKFKTLKGIDVLDIGTTETIHDLGANTYVTKAGDDVTSEGKTVSGEYVDIIHSRDYLVFSIQYAIQKLLNRAPKVRYDNTGIAQLESEARTILKRADLNGMIAHDDEGQAIFNTNFKPRSQVDPADREQRVYNDGSFEFELAGAIHGTKIKGTIKL